MSDCWFWDVDCNVSEAANKVAENVVVTWGRSTLESLDKTLVNVGTFWVDMDTPNVSASGSPAVFVREVTGWITVAVATGSIMVAGIMLMWNQRGEEMRKILGGVLRMIIVSGACFMVTDLLIDICDMTSAWVLDQALVESKGDFATSLLVLAEVSPGTTGWLVIILGCIIGILANIVQMMIMLVRSAILPLIAGIIPLAAAASINDWGRQWLNKLTAWLMSFILMKPAAAIIYAVAIKTVAGDSSSRNPILDDLPDGAAAVVAPIMPGTAELNMMEFLRGCVLLVAAALALPALMRLIMPAAESLGAGGGALGAMAGGMALATGAARVGRAMGSRSKGASGPTRASSAGARSGRGPDSRPTGARPTGGGGGSGGGAGAGATGRAAAAGGAARGGAAAAGSGTAAAGSSAAAGGAAAGAAGGPAGAAAGAVIMVGAKAAKGGVDAARSTVEQGAQAPSGSQDVLR